ncbi:MAG: radical SAM protein [Candidatus Omnitrophota bacterium]
MNLPAKFKGALAAAAKNIPCVSFLARKLYSGFFNFPKVLQLLVTDDCNFDCVYCYVKDRNTSRMPLEKCLDILFQAKALGVRIVTFSGGEPFLYRGFRELLARAAELGLGIEILTNGSLIDREWMDFLEGLDKKTRLSLVFKFSHDRETYRRHTGSDNFEKLVSCIRDCRKRGLKVFVFLVLTRYEYPHLEETLEEAKALGAWPVLQRYIPAGSGDAVRRLEISAREYGQGLLKFRDFYARNKKIYGDYHYFSAVLRQSVCACYRDMMVVGPRGDILPCPAAPSELSLGNIGTVSLKEAWGLFREGQKEWLKMSPACLKCGINHICGGGCISHKYLAAGRFDSDDPLCFRPGEIAAVEGLSAPCRMHENE